MNNAIERLLALILVVNVALFLLAVGSTRALRDISDQTAQSCSVLVE